MRLGEDREFARKYRLRKTFPEMMNDAGDVDSENIVAETPNPKIEGKYSILKKPNYLVWGAIAVIIIGIFIILSVFRPGEMFTILKHVPLNDSNTIQKVNQSSRITVHQDSDSTMRKPIELNSPDDGVMFSRKDEILFSWELETDTFTNLYVFSESNHKLVWWRGIKPGIRENKVPAINFLPGRFYWYVGSKDVKRTFIIDE